VSTTVAYFRKGGNHIAFLINPPGIAHLQTPLAILTPASVYGFKEKRCVEVPAKGEIGVVAILV
jgi:hypothetical protein